MLQHVILEHVTWAFSAAISASNLLVSGFPPVIEPGWRDFLPLRHKRDK